MQSVEGESSVGVSATWRSELRKRLVTHRAVSSPVCILARIQCNNSEDQTLKTHKTFKSRIIKGRYSVWPSIFNPMDSLATWTAGDAPAAQRAKSAWKPGNGFSTQSWCSQGTKRPSPLRIACHLVRLGCLGSNPTPYTAVNISLSAFWNSNMQENKLNKIRHLLFGSIVIYVIYSIQLKSKLKSTFLLTMLTKIFCDPHFLLKSKWFPVSAVWDIDSFRIARLTHSCRSWAHQPGSITPCHPASIAHASNTFFCVKKGKPQKYHGIENYIFVGGDFDIFMTWVVHFDTCSTLDFHNLHLAKCSPTFHPRYAAWWHPTLHLQHLPSKRSSKHPWDVSSDFGLMTLMTLMHLNVLDVLACQCCRIRASTVPGSWNQTWCDRRLCHIAMLMFWDHFRPDSSTVFLQEYRLQ